MGLFFGLIYAQQYVPQQNQQYQQTQDIQYEDPMTGARLIFHPKTGEVVGFEASGEAELTFGDRRDIRIATKKAIKTIV